MQYDDPHLPGTTWEFEQVLRSGCADKLFLLTPPDVGVDLPNGGCGQRLADVRDAPGRPAAVLAVDTVLDGGTPATTLPTPAQLVGARCLSISASSRVSVFSTRRCAAGPARFAAVDPHY